MSAIMKWKRQSDDRHRMQRIQERMEAARPLRDHAEVILVDNALTCQRACEEIEAHGPVIGVDCEAAGMKRSGRLCLVQISITDNPRDPVASKHKVFDNGLKRVLENPNLIKVLHDCRLDSDILYHQYQVKINNVYDTQIAYAIAEVALPRGRFPLPTSLNRVLEKYAAGRSNTFKDQAKDEMMADAEYWARRPMDSVMLGYASEDVSFLPFVWRQFQAGFSLSQKESVRDHSAEYAAQCRDSPTEVDRNSTAGELPKYGIEFFDFCAGLNVQTDINGKRVFRVPRRVKDKLALLTAYDFNTVITIDEAAPGEKRARPDEDTGDAGGPDSELRRADDAKRAAIRHALRD